MKDGRVPEAGVLAYQGRRLKAVQLRHVNVQKNQGRLVFEQQT